MLEMPLNIGKPDSLFWLEGINESALLVQASWPIAVEEMTSIKVSYKMNLVKERQKRKEINLKNRKLLL